MFGFARAYFMVYFRCRRLVAFLRQIMPRKPDYEIYNAIGCQKQWQDRALSPTISSIWPRAGEQFVIAPASRDGDERVPLLLRCGVQGDKDEFAQR